MRRTALVSLLLLATSALVPASAGAAVGDTVDLHVTHRGDTPWLTSAEVVLPGGGTDPLVLDGALGTATAAYQAPETAGDPTSYDLTDVVPVPADRPFTVTAPNGASVALPGVTVGFGPGTTEVSGTAGAGDTVEVRLRSGGQDLAATVTADGTDGGYTADFPSFDGSWEFGASITATVTRTASDDTVVALHVTHRLPDADITTQVVNAGPPASRFSSAVFTEITPGHPFAAVGEPSTVTFATATASFDPDAEDTVTHLGRTLKIDVPTLAVDAVDFTADAVVGVAPPGQTVDVLAATDAGVETGSVVAGSDGSWSFELTGDATSFANVDAAIDHTDGARHHAQGTFTASDGGDAGEEPVLAFALLPIDTLVLLPFAEGTGDTYEITATTPSGTSTATATGFELLAGLAPDDFSPPVDFAAGMDIAIDQGGTLSDVRIPALDWTIDDSGTVVGATDPGQTVEVLSDVPVAGVSQFPVTGDTTDGSLSFTIADWTDGSELTGYIFPELNERADLVFVIDQQFADPIEHAIGADGGRAPGLGNNALTIDSLGLLAASAQVPTAWRMDTVVAPGGPTDLAVRYPAQQVDPEAGFFGLDAVTPISDVFTVEVLTGGSAVQSSPAALTTYVPLNVDGSLGTVVSEPSVLADTGAGFEPVPAEQVTFCLEASAAGCDDFPIPYAAVSGAEVGTYTVVDDRSVPNTLTADRVSGGAGTGRIETAIALSEATFPEGGADAVVIANSRDFPDALASAPLAAAANAPVLLNPADRLDPAVQAEIERLGVERAYVMGGTAAISRGVQIAIGRDADVKAVTRVAGPDRFGTAAEAARFAVELWNAQGDTAAGSEVLVALGRHDVDDNRAWPDALAAGQLAAYSHQPILLTRQGAVPAATNTALSELGARTVTVVGGTAAIPDATKNALGPDGTNRRRIAGADRYATGTALADEATLWGADDSIVLTATGLAFPDGLTAAAAAYHQGGVLLLVHGRDASRSAATLDWLGQRAGVVSLLRAIGGTAAISEDVLDALVDAASTSATDVRRQQAGAVHRSANSTQRVWLRS